MCDYWESQMIRILQHWAHWAQLWSQRFFYKMEQTIRKTFKRKKRRRRKAEKNIISLLLLLLLWHWTFWLVIAGIMAALFHSGCGSVTVSQNEQCQDAETEAAHSLFYTCGFSVCVTSRHTMTHWFCVQLIHAGPSFLSPVSSGFSLHQLLMQTSGC